MIWKAVQRILQSKEGKINSKMLGTPRALVVPVGTVIPDDVKDMSLNLGAEIIFSEKVSGGIALSWIPVSTTQIPKSIWVIFENFTAQ
ncbi:MAG: hypothetical protein A2W93_14200 [Bacteroidetes bacterium GWF2_43_63]|nr:MAG: hypothetical protein A2W94_00770 [Bacteroidetes bacterium GWE2_42_42]OFY52493.1 MAG: hypothetical protein A2W93_14200 [Bacteroidetes bacterium GWF2_43_63]HBG71400.1 hypothetical protein [Bacteroidales bacterium]HCB60848.1 hypothetical protein [Bacteroidales bacterium]HCY23427.1 hypothetical protein [Bacteroidales bacterium]